MRPNLDLLVHQQVVPAGATKEDPDVVVSVADLAVVWAPEVVLVVAAVKSMSPTFVTSFPL